LERNVLLNGVSFKAKGDQESNPTTKSRKVRLSLMSTFFYIPYLKIEQRRKTNTQPRDASTATGDTAAESVRNLLKKNPKYSKRINYDALKDLFVQSGGLPSMAANMTTGDDDKDDADLYTMDDDKDDDGEEGVLTMPTVIVEDEPGTVILTPVKESATAKFRSKKGVLAFGEADMDDEGSDDDKDDDDDDDGRGTGWEDAYEQEV
jgi:transcription factor IIIB 90 kDa subunit